MNRASSLRFFLFLLPLLPGLSLAASPIQDRADRFLKLANAGYQAAYKRGEQRQKASRTPLVGRQWSSLVVRQPARGEFRGESREKRRRTMMSERERLLAMEETEAT